MAGSDVHGGKIVIVLATVLLRCRPCHWLIDECELGSVRFAEEWTREATCRSIAVDIVPLSVET